MTDGAVGPMEADPRAYIDRTVEREKFLAMFPPEPLGTHRIMQIFAPSGSGKSGLLRLFRDYCGNEVDARSVLIDLRIDDNQAPLTVLDIARAIQDAIAYGAEFAEFTRLTDALEVEDREVFFGKREPSVHIYKANTYVSHVQGTTVTGMQNMPAEQGPLPFNSGERDVATRRCLDAFGKELGALVATTPVLIAVDHWERGPRELQEWVQRQLIRTEIGGAESSRLRLVIAGQPRTPDWPLGLVDGQFKHEFATAVAFEAAVSRHPTLSAFKEEELASFLELYGLPRAHPRFQDALTMMRILAEGAEYNPQVLLNNIRFAQSLP